MRECPENPPCTSSTCDIFSGAGSVLGVAGRFCFGLGSASRMAAGRVPAQLLGDEQRVRMQFVEAVAAVVNGGDHCFELPRYMRRLLGESGLRVRPTLVPNVITRVSSAVIFR